MNADERRSEGRPARPVTIAASLRRFVTVTAASLLLLAGCKAGPDYVRAAAETPAAYKELGDWKPAQPRDHELRGKWWERYGDPLLNALQEEVDVSNQNLAQVEAQYRQAQALVRLARASYFPELSASASVTRSKPSSGNTNTTARGPNTNYSTGLNATWEPDLWGRVRRTVEGNVASAQASAAEIESARLSIQAELAQNYFQLRALDAQKKLLDDTVDAFQTSVKLTQNRYDVGVVARADVIQAQAQLKATQAQALDVGVTRAQLEHAIALLTGKPPAALTIPRGTMAIALPPIPVGLPSELLERRPDIAAAERRMAAANAQIGVAEAAYFPALTLSASTGFQSRSFATLFNAPSQFWSVGSALAQVLFDAGARRAQTDSAIAAYDANVASYRQTVLTGFREVEDNLAALSILEEEAAVQSEAVGLARQSVALTINQYKAGIVSYLNVLTAQASWLSNERAAVDILNRRLAASVLLIRALGGGWEAGSLPTAAEASQRKIR